VGARYEKLLIVRSLHTKTTTTIASTDYSRQSLNPITRALTPSFIKETKMCYFEWTNEYHKLLKTVKINEVEPDEQQK